MANNLATEMKILAVAMLGEGNSIRSIERMTGVHRDTIMRLEFVTILEIPPVESPETAVKIAIAARSNQKTK